MKKNNRRSNKAAGVAAGLAAVMAVSPVMAETENTEDVLKHETVYVNADAEGNVKEITVSEWLENAGDLIEIQDVSELQDIVNVKGDETFSQDGENLVWNSNGGDIF